MIYTVLWKPSAERGLADIWSSAADRQAVRNAADAIDEVLRRTPYRVGESRSASERIAFSPPLGVCYAVFEADRVVEVLRVWRIRGPKS